MSVKDLVRRVLVSDTVYPHLRKRASAGGAALVLTYHTLGRNDESFDAWTVLRVSDFLRQVEHLRQHHDIVSMDTALSRHQANQTSGRPSVVLTFDDGHSGWHEHLLALVEREALPVTLYVATAHIRDAQPYWFDRVMNALQVSEPVTIDLRAQGLRLWRLGAVKGQAHWLVISDLLESLKRCPAAVREDCARAVEAQTRAVLRHDYAPLRPMTVAELQAVARSPYVTIGAHSDDHQLLDELPADEAEASMKASRQWLRQWTGQSVDHFAFPNGNFNQPLVDVARKLGFASAATTVQKAFRPSDSAFQIPRLSVGRFDTMDQFRLKLVRA